jgi:very-short-patch-repair endonuclease
MLSLEEMKKSFNKVSFFVQNSEQEELGIFNGICDRAKQLLWNIASIETGCLRKPYINEELKELTPIEQIFATAFRLFFRYFENEGIYRLYDIVLEKQVSILSNGKRYRVDFLIKEINYFEERKIKTIKLKKPLIIEADGYDSHCSKEQLNHDIERENNLKMDGFGVIRFTGTQVYKEPYECVMKALKYVYDENEEIFTYLRELKDGRKR